MPFRSSKFILLGFVVAIISTAAAHYHSHYHSSRPVDDLKETRECSSQEIFSFKSCPRTACVENPKCCVKTKRLRCGRIYSREYLCGTVAPAAPPPVAPPPVAPPPVPVAPPPPAPVVPPAAPEPVGPSSPPSKRKRGRRGRRVKPKAEANYCSHEFELDCYKPCPIKFCRRASLVNEQMCCKRRQFYSVPETCLCHPDSSCGMGGQDNPEEDEREDSKEPNPDDDPRDNPDPDGPDDSEDLDDPPPPSLCSDRLRLLNADKVDDSCQYKGVAQLTRRVNNRDTLVCNAVYTIAQIEGVVQRTFLTPQACGQLLDDDTINLEMDIKVGDQVFPVTEPIFTTATGPNGNWYLKIGSRYTNLFRDLGACQDNACPYNAKAMGGKVDFNDCKAVSYGATDASTLTSDGLYETAIALYPGGCLDQTDFFNVTETLCFRTLDDENAYCANDAGAPVYCNAPATKEWILLGMLAFQNVCDARAELKVIPFPI